MTYLPDKDVTDSRGLKGVTLGSTLTDLGWAIDVQWENGRITRESADALDYVEGELTP